jgi:cephalosporin-C deacetylase
MKPLILLFAILALVPRPSFGDATDDFWRATRERLAREPMEAKVEPVAEALPYKSFKVTLRGLDGVHFVARLALPVQGEGGAKPWPVIITTTGYSGWQQGLMLSECQRGYAVLQVFTRGQGESAALWKLDGDKLTAHLDDPDGAFYQGACCDIMRAVDFALTRDDLDHDRIALVGTSQGGGIALAVAALDERVKAVVAHVPFLCNMPLAARTPGSLVKQRLDKAGRNDGAALRTLAYFDPYELAPRLCVPVLMSAGGKDTLCPMATIQSTFERIAAERKTLKTYPELPHTSCVDFYNATWTWLDQNFRG